MDDLSTCKFKILNTDNFISGKYFIDAFVEEVFELENICTYT